MNLIAATVSSAGGRIRVDADGISGQLWEGDTTSFPATLGVRPEHWEIGDVMPHSAGVSAVGIIDTIENLGSEEILYCTAGAHRIAVRMPRTDSLSVGQSVTLAANAEHVHLFDSDTGRRLEWVAERDSSGADSIPELTTA